jgi:hypothetical protein
MYLEKLFQDPRSLRGVEEARAAVPGRFDPIAEMFLRWLVKGWRMGRLGAAGIAQRLLPRGRLWPPSMALVLQKRVNDIF